MKAKFILTDYADRTRREHIMTSWKMESLTEKFLLPIIANIDLNDELVIVQMVS